MTLTAGVVSFAPAAINMANVLCVLFSLSLFTLLMYCCLERISPFTRLMTLADHSTGHAH